jgi:hypothetical protein
VVPRTGAGDPPEYLPADPADRLEHLPGRAAQCDLWFPPVRIGVGYGQHAVLPVLVMVARILPVPHGADAAVAPELLRGEFGAAPHELWWDNEPGIGRRGSSRCSRTSRTALALTSGAYLLGIVPSFPQKKVRLPPDGGHGVRRLVPSDCGGSRTRLG